MHFLSVSLGYHPDVVGGAWRVAAEQAEGLARRGHTVSVVTSDPDGTRPPEETRAGVRLFRFTKGTGSIYSRWRTQNRAAAALIRRILAEAGAPTLLLQHHAWLEPAIATLPAPVLHVFHGPWAEEYRLSVRSGPRPLARRVLDTLASRLMHRVETRALRRAARVLVLSDHFARRLRQWHPGRLPPLITVAGGADFRRFHPPDDRDLARTRWGLKPGDTLLLATRRLDARMGLDVLIDAFARVAARFPAAQLWMTGTGPAEAALRDRIAAARIKDRVRLLGFVPDDQMPDLLGAADLALMPSLDLEGFGLATVEALACGTPVLGSRAGATPEILEPLDAGLLFEPGSVPDLADRLAHALSHPERLPSREQCASHARARFSWDPQLAACEAAHADLIPVAPAR